MFGIEDLSFDEFDFDNNLFIDNNDNDDISKISLNNVTSKKNETSFFSLNCSNNILGINWNIIPQKFQKFSSNSFIHSIIDINQIENDKTFKKNEYNLLLFKSVTLLIGEHLKDSENILKITLNNFQNEFIIKLKNSDFVESEKNILDNLYLELIRFICIFSEIVILYYKIPDYINFDKSLAKTFKIENFKQFITNSSSIYFFN